MSINCGQIGNALSCLPGGNSERKHRVLPSLVFRLTILIVGSPMRRRLAAKIIIVLLTGWFSISGAVAAPTPLLPQVEALFGQLLPRYQRLPLQNGGCSARLPQPNDTYQLVKRMQEIVNQVDDSYNVERANQSSVAEALSFTESVVKVHLLMQMAAVIIGYPDLHQLHRRMIDDLLARHGDPNRDLNSIISNYLLGGQPISDLYDDMQQRFVNSQLNSAGRYRVTVRSCSPTSRLRIDVSSPGTASYDGLLWAESTSLQMCDPIVSNQHIKYYLSDAEARSVSLDVNDYAFVNQSNDQLKFDWVRQTKAQFDADSEIPLISGVPLLSSQTSRELSIPDGTFSVFLEDPAGRRLGRAGTLVTSRAEGPSEFIIQCDATGSATDVTVVASQQMETTTVNPGYAQWLVPTWKMADLSIGINERTRKMEGSVAGRSFHLLNDNLAFQGQAELAFRSHSDVSLSPPVGSTESERVSDFYGTDFQFDFGPVVRAGSFQLAAINSFRWVTREDFDEGGLLSQSSFNFDYLSPGIGQVGAFFTLNHGSAPVVRTTQVDATVIAEEFLSVMRQAGMTFRLNLPHESSLEGTLGYLDSAMERNRPGGVLRHIYPLGGNVSLTSEVGLNESFVAADDSWRFAVGLRIGDWGRGRSRGVGATSTDTGPVPVVVPRLRYERLTRLVRPDNGRPVADAGQDRTIDAGTRVVLDGSGSFDPDGDSLNYEWTQISGGVPLVLGDRNSAHPEFIAGEDDVYKFDLVVTDILGFTSEPDTVSISVRQEPVLREFRVDPREIEEDETARLYWDVEGVPSVRIQHVHMETGQEGIFDALQSNDARDVMPEVGVTRYSLFALDESGAVVGPEPLAQAEIRVNPKPQTQITLFDADPEIVRSGESTTLTWTVVGATGSCRFGTETGGALEELSEMDCNHSERVEKITGTTTFVLRVHSKNGEIVDEAKVRVRATF